MTEPLEPTELETAILSVYSGPLEEFVSRRDALAKQLRAAKRRDDADRVKALRKPSRTAWVLDTVAQETPNVLEQLATAIGAAQTVQSGADLRTALENVRTAIRDVAAAGARVAIRAGHPIDASALVTAVHAVIGETEAFNDLRAGRLVDIPDGGGLDILSAITFSAPASPPVAPAPSSPPRPTSPVAVPPPNETRRAAAAEEAEAAARAKHEAELAAAARAELQRAESSLADANERADSAERAVRDAEARLDAAEQALLQAQAEVQARRADVEHARRAADTATAQVRDAERAVATAAVRGTARDRRR